MIRTTTWIAAAAIAIAMVSPTAFADGKNEIRAVTFEDDAGTTRVHVRGAETPTFTVYKLERPSRVVLDIPRARLAAALRGHEGAALLTPSTWAVNTIAAHQLHDGGDLVRVIVSLARPGRYDVKTEGNAVVLMVSARDPAPKSASPEQLVKAEAEAERLRRIAAEQSARAAALQKDQQASKAEIARAKAEAAKAAERARDQIARAQQMAEAAKQAAARETAAAAKTRAEAERVKQDAEAAQQLAVQQRAAAEAAKRKALREAEAAAKQLAAAEAAKQKALREAEAARRDLARTKAEAAAARREVARTKAEAAAAQAAAQKELDAAARAKAEAERARREAAVARSEAAANKDAVARSEAAAQAARSEARSARSEAEAAKADAARARAEAEAAKTAAAADRKRAESARAESDRMLREAKRQLAALDKKTQTIQALEDKARAANAAAQAREEAARAEVARAAKERAAAEAAAKAAAERAAIAMKQSSKQSATLATEAREAEEALARARHATEKAEADRKAAELAAAGAKKQLAQTRNMLAAMEQQRAAAETAATTAARQRSEAEAATEDATRRRSAAEAAARLAAQRRKDAEAAARAAAAQRGEAEAARLAAELQRKAAEDAARQARAAAEAAEKQRTVAEAAARTATEKRTRAEASLAELTAKRRAAERAAVELEARSKAEAKAKAAIAAAEARKATDRELANARAEAARLAKERIAAETALAERRKAVAAQQAEASRLEAAAAQARDAASREEARRAQLAQQRVREEKELARIKAEKTAPPPRVAQAPKRTRPVPTGPAAKVNDIRFQGGTGAAQVDIALAGNASITIGTVTATHAELIIDNAELAAKLERKLDVTKFGSPVRAVSSFRDRRTPNRVRLIAELAQPVKPVFDRHATGGKWRFVATNRVAQRPVQSVPPPVVGGFGATSTPVTQHTVSQLPPQGARGRRVYRGATVDFDFKDAPLHDLLRLLGDTGRVNIVVPENIDPKVTVRLKRVPWDQALDVILQSHGLWYRRDGNIYRIAPRKELDAEDEAEAARRASAVKAEAPRSQIVPLNYASANELKAKLEPMLSPKGRIEVDPRTNSLIVVDIAGNRQEIERLAVSLDTQTPQISIEARIVEARSTFIRQFGIQWGGRATASAAGGNATGLIFPSSVDLRGANEDAQTNATGIVQPSDFAINLPAATGTGEGGAIGLSLGSIGGNFAINLRLSALEDTGTIRIISAPKITVLNNKPAKISQGVSIPISVISAAGTQTQFVQADLSLEVTPYVSQKDCAIAMELNVTKNEPDFVNTGARGDPTILRKEARTSMLVQDGETSVLGGIYTRNSGLAYKKVPFFADIPVLGWFFKNRRENDDRTEILVFITPKITNRALLRCQ